MSIFKPTITGSHSSIRQKFLVSLGLLALTACLTIQASAAQAHEQSTVERKLVTRIEPEYPETLKRLYIGGVVRIEAVVAGNGTVESTELIGGNPILGQSAMKAVKQWKYASGSAKSRVMVQLEFDPHR